MLRTALADVEGRNSPREMALDRTLGGVLGHGAGTVVLGARRD